jgi:hypothetical protein
MKFRHVVFSFELTRNISPHNHVSTELLVTHAAKHGR